MFSVCMCAPDYVYAKASHVVQLLRRPARHHAPLPLRPLPAQGEVREVALSVGALGEVDLHLALLAALGLPAGDLAGSAHASGPGRVVCMCVWGGGCG